MSTGGGGSLAELRAAILGGGVGDGSTVRVQMMQTPKTKLRAAHDAQGTLVELPYGGHDIVFLAYIGDVVPNDLTTFQTSLETHMLNTLIDALSEEEHVGDHASAFAAIALGPDPDIQSARSQRSVRA